jgi:hypothetical protein
MGEAVMPEATVAAGQLGIVIVELTEAGPRWDPFAVGKIGQTYQ